MEDIGPEAVKRQRLDSAGNALAVQRMQHQQYNHQRTAAPTPHPLQLHNTGFGGAPLGPPSYNQVPPSPYDSRNPADQPPPLHQQHHQQQQQYRQPGSGYSTPNREVRPPFAESGPPHHLRRESGAMPGPPRSPDDAQQHMSQHPQGPGPAMRPVNTEFESQGYPPAYPPPNPSGHPGDMGNIDPAAGGPYMNPDAQQPNGTYHAMPLGQHPPNGPHHPHAMSNGPPPQAQLAYAQYAGTPMDVPPGTPVYAQFSQNMGGQPQMKKNARATQACENCRARKAKCDEGKPQCGACREAGTDCKYKDIPPAKHERAQREIIEKYDAINTELKNTNKRVEEVSEQNKRILDLLAEMVGRGAPTPQIRPTNNSINPSTPTEGYPAKKQRKEDVYYPTRWVTSGVVIAGNEAIPGGPVTLNHNTGAHRLFRWGKIKGILKGMPLDENYVMKLEEQKGVLHYYGKGQGQDRFEGFNTPVPGSPASPATDDINMSQEMWGTDLGRPYVSEARFFGGRDDSLGGLTLDGTLNLDWGVMESLKGMYLSHFHLLHPILNIVHLRVMFERVYRQANPNSINNHQSSPYLKSVLRDPPRTTSSKRKYSADYGGEPGTPGGGRSAGRAQEQPLERRISTAIVLLVLALGKICEHSEPLPGPVQPVQEGSFTAHTDRSMPAPSLPVKAESPAANADTPLHDAGSSIPSPMSISDRGVPTSSSTSVTAHSGATPQDGSGQRPMRAGDRNVDVVPGLAYYVRAVEILGVLHGGNEIAHAQAFILAALYCSQNGCVLESWAWLQNACRVARFHVREDYLAAETKRNPDGANIIRFVFYTALQLEGDITAELDVPDSGIAKLHSDRVSQEKEIGLPKGVADDNQQISIQVSSMNLTEMFYSYQLSMRTLLNDIQEHLYPKSGGSVEMRQQEQFDEGIKLWRQTLTEKMAWDDDDEPSTEINAARLRAKYYGARYIIHRPSLYHALHEMTIEDWPKGWWSVGGNGDSDSAENLDAGSAPNNDLSDAQARILRSCKMCVKSAIHSTSAFDGMMFDHSGRNIKQRLVVTNIFGTAHAQFGNMLVLSAVYNSYMSSLIDRSKLLQLLRRTIKFLRSLAPISSTLKQDSLLLEHVFYNIVNEQKSKIAESVMTDGPLSQRPDSVITTPTQAQPTLIPNLKSSFNSMS